MEVQSLAIEALTADPRNTRKHSTRNVAAIAASLDEFEQQTPIVVSSDMIIRKGNGTYLAAKKLGWTHLDCVVTDLTGSALRAYAIADNRSGDAEIGSTWNGLVLAEELVDLKADYDLDTLGFEEIEFEALAKEHDLIDVTGHQRQAPEPIEPPGEPQTRPKDLWFLGPHRLLCADATQPMSFHSLMDSQKANLLLTDPPYNVALGMNETPEQAAARNRRTDGKVVANDSMSDDEFLEFLTTALTFSFDVMEAGASFYIWHADSEGYNFRKAIHDCKQKVRQCLIWKKNALVMGRQDYHWIHEPCLYGWKGGGSHSWYNDRKQTTVLEFDRPTRSKQHPTMKPMDLIAYQIENSAPPKGIVLDPFLGSGTTLLAANELGRKCFGLELDPAYCDVICRRYYDMTGDVPQRLAGAAFETKDAPAASGSVK